MPTAYRAQEYVSGSSVLAFGRESNFSVASNPTRRLGITNQGIDFPDVKKDVRQYRDFGSGPQYFQSRFGKNDYSSSLSFLPTTAEVFYYAMGQDLANDPDFPALGATEAGANLHVMPPIEGGQLPSMTLWSTLKGSPNFTRKAQGTVITGFTASLAETSELSLSIPINSRITGADFSNPTPFTQPSSDGLATQVPTPFMFYDRNALIQVMGSYAGPGRPLAGGRSFARVRSFSLTHSREVAPIMAFLDGTTPTSPANSPADDPRNPLTFVAGAADTTLNLEITPAGISGPVFTDGTGASRGSSSGGVDAVYDLLQQEITGDILIPFRRSRLVGSTTIVDHLDFVFQDCKIRTANHPLPENRGVVTVSADVTVNKFKVVSQDSMNNYGVL